MDPTPSANVWLGRILHTTDFSRGSELAFVHALKLALAAHGELSIVHIDVDDDPSNNDWNDFPGVRGTLTSWGLLEEDAPRTAVSERLGMKVRKLDLGARDALEGVLNLLRRHPADMVVLANRAYEGVRRWTHSSVSHPLARQADAPTLFLPKGARGFVDPATGAVRLRRILVPIDDRPAPEPAVELARKLADAIGAPEARITLLHVGADWPSTLGLEQLDGGIERLERTGGVVDAIVGAADQLDADLIVMATEGHDGILDALRGSTTEQVLRRARRALIAVPVA